MSLLKTLAKETAIYGLSFSLVRVLNFVIMTPYLSKRIFPHDGAFMSIHQDIYLYVALFLGVLTLRMETSLFRFIEDPKYKNSIYAIASKLIIGVALIFIVICYIWTAWIQRALHYPDSLQAHIIIAAWIVFFDAICSVPFAYLRYKNKAKKYAVIKVCSVLFNILIVLFIFDVLPLWVPDFSQHLINPDQRLWYILFANMLSSVIAFCFLYKEMADVFYTKGTDWKILKPVLNYSWPLILVTLAFTINTTGATSFLKMLLPGTNMQNFEQTKEYVAAWRLAVIMNIFVTTFNYAAEPFFFKHQKREDSRQVYADVSLYFVISCCFIYLGICLFKDIAHFFFPSSYLGSIYLISILMMANIFSGISTNFSAWYKLSDNTRMAAIINISGLALTFIHSILFIPKFGLEASAWILLACNVFITIASYVQGQKHYPIPYNMTKIILYLLASLCIVFFIPRIIELLKFGKLYEYLIYTLVMVIFCIYIYFFEYKNNRLNNRTQ